MVPHPLEDGVIGGEEYPRHRFQMPALEASDHSGIPLVSQAPLSLEKPDTHTVREEIRHQYPRARLRALYSAKCSSASAAVEAYRTSVDPNLVPFALMASLT